jgi:hypothetical protein
VLTPFLPTLMRTPGATLKDFRNPQPICFPYSQGRRHEMQPRQDWSNQSALMRRMNRIFSVEPARRIWRRSPASAT